MTTALISRASVGPRPFSCDHIKYPKTILQRNALRFQPHPSQPSSRSTPILRTSTAETTPVSDEAGDNNNTDKMTKLLVTELLELIKDTDSGDAISPETRSKVDSIIYRLADIGQGSKPLDNALIFANCNVAYVSTGKKQLGAPAGGRYRTGIGKLLFKTKRLCQSILQPDLAINKVEFALFGVLRGSVGLRGKFISIPEKEGGQDLKDTVKVFFEPPVFSLPGLHIRIGPPSSVVLKTTYVDERIRLGLGSRGSLFVFTRGGDADNAHMDQVGIQKSTPFGLAFIAACITAMIAAGGYTVSQPSSPAPAKAAGVLGVVLGLALARVMYRGGQFNDPPDRPDVKLPQAAAT